MNSRTDINADPANFNLVKICGPRLPSGLIERRGLNDSYTALRRARLGCVRAPAGSGKTSLLLQWRSRLVAEGVQVVWLSLDAEDDDPWSFFRYLGLALLRLPGLNGLKGGYEVPAHAIGAQSQVAEMLHALAQETDEIFIFVDDFHHIANEQILHALAALLQSAPPNLHLVLASRTLPKLPLAKLRAADEVVEIDYASLRFSPEECSEFYHKGDQPGPRGSDLARLTLLTDGWPAGLRLFEIALRNKRLSDLPFEDLARNRNLQDYLLETVLNGLPADRLNFLTQTAILNRLCASLCEAVTGLPHCQELIELIERQGLFLCALDEHRGWYAYHPLFAEMLRQRLISQKPDLLIELHRRAANWFLSHQVEDEALLHALAGRDDALAADLIEKGAVSIDALNFRNFNQILAWHGKLSPDFRKLHPELLLLLAFHCLIKVDWRQGAALLGQLDDHAAADHAVDCLGMRSIISYYQVDLEAAIRDAEAFLDQRVSALLPALERAVVDHLSGAYILAGRMADADRLLTELQRLTKQVPLSYVETQRQKIVFLFDGYFRGHFNEGVAQASDVMESLCSRYLMESQMGSVTAILLIVGLYETGEVERTHRLLQDWSDVIERHSISTVFAALQRVWTRIVTETQGIAAGLDHINRAIDTSMERREGPTSSLLLLEKARLLRRQGDLAAAWTIVRRVAGEKSESFMSLGAPWAACAPVHLGAEAALLMAESRWDEVIALLSPAIETLREKGLLFGMWCLQALVISAEWNRGDAGAIDHLRELVTAAQPSGVMRSIVDHSNGLREPLLQLLKEAPDGPVRGYLERLVAAYGRPAAGPAKAGQELKLSAREIDILKAVADGLTNKEIARALNLGAETVKWHISNILQKLDADTRRRAVTKAKQLGLL